MLEGKIIVLGVNHNTAPVEVRERMAFDRSALGEALRRVRGLPCVQECAILSTCNRVEIVASASDEKRALEEIKAFLAQRGSLGDYGGLDDHLYTYFGPEAVRHLFRVAASLDSMVLGEPQILGQLKEYYEAAREAGTVGTLLHRLFHRSFSVAKRVRTETGVGTGSVSVSSAAVELAKRIFDRLEDKTVMLIGAGETGELVLRHLRRNGVKSIMVTNRTFERAVELAQQYQGSPIRFGDFPRYLRLADVVIGSTSSPDILSAGQVVEVLKERKRRAVFFIDLGVPRNFDPRINEIDNVYLYNIDDLRGVAQENLKGREAEAHKALQIVEEEVAGFFRWLGSLEHVPTIVALRKKLEDIRRKELEKSLGTTLKELSEKERQALEDMTAAIINKILHAPITHLKRQPEGEDSLCIETLRRLFDLEDE